MLFDGEGIELWLKGKACWNSWQIDLSNPSLTISSPRPCVKLGGGNTLIQPRLVHYTEVSNMIPSDCRFIGRAADYLDPNVNVNVLQVNASVFRTRIKPNSLLQFFFFSLYQLFFFFRPNTAAPVRSGYSGYTPTFFTLPPLPVPRKMKRDSGVLSASNSLTKGAIKALTLQPEGVAQGCNLQAPLFFAIQLQNSFRAAHLFS